MYIEIRVKLQPDMTELIALDLGEEIKDILMNRDSELHFPEIADITYEIKNVQTKTD